MLSSTSLAEKTYLELIAELDAESFSGISYLLSTGIFDTIFHIENR